MQCDKLVLGLISNADFKSKPKEAFGPNRIKVKTHERSEYQPHWYWDGSIECQTNKHIHWKCYFHYAYVNISLFIFSGSFAITKWCIFKREWQASDSWISFFQTCLQQCYSNVATPHFTNNVWGHNPNLENIQIVLTLPIMVQLGHDFAHANSAELKGHAQSFDSIW